MYPDKTYTRKALYRRPTLHCSIYSVNPTPPPTPNPLSPHSWRWFISKERWRALLSLIMYGFCSDKALYLASLSFTMFIGPVAVARQSYEKESVHPSLSLSLYVFLELDHQLFLNFGMVLETQMKWSLTEPDLFQKNFFCIKDCEHGSKLVPKQDFFGIY